MLRRKIALARSLVAWRSFSFPEAESRNCRPRANSPSSDSFMRSWPGPA
jgi:hypothetical protein